MRMQRNVSLLILLSLVFLSSSIVRAKELRSDCVVTFLHGFSYPPSTLEGYSALPGTPVLSLSTQYTLSIDSEIPFVVIGQVYNIHSSPHLRLLSHLSVRQ